MTPEFPERVEWMTLEYMFVSSTDGPTYREATTKRRGLSPPQSNTKQSAIRQIALIAYSRRHLRAIRSIRKCSGVPPANWFLAEIALHTSQLLAVFASNGRDVTSAKHRYSSQIASPADMLRMVSLEHMPTTRERRYNRLSHKLHDNR